MSHKKLASVLWMVMAVSGFMKAASAAEEERARIIERAKAATVLVDLGEAGSGSGFCIDSAGLFLTNSHVIASLGLGGEARLVVHPGQKDEAIVTARVILQGKEHDLALLQAKGKPRFTALKLADETTLRETDSIMAFGYPFGRLLATDPDGYPSISVNSGEITALRRQEGQLKIIQIDAAVNPGNSGGPVLNRKGEVVGIVVSGVPWARVNQAISAGVVNEFLSRPALVVQEPKFRYAERHQPLQFDIEIVHPLKDRPVDSVEMIFEFGDNKTGPHKAVKTGASFSVSAVPVADEKNLPPLRLDVQTGDRRVNFEAADAKFQLGSKPFHLVEVRRIEKRPDGHVVTTTDGRKYFGSIKGLTPILRAEQKEIAPNEIDQIDIHSVDPVPKRLRYQVMAHQGDKVLASSEGVLSVQGVPHSLSGNDRVDPYAPEVNELVLETRIDGRSDLHITPYGLFWEHQTSAKPGLADAQGRYTWVNGRKWYPSWHATSADSSEADTSERYPLKIGGAVWDVQVLSIRETPESRHDGRRGRVEQEPKSDEWVLKLHDTAAGSAIYRLYLRKQTFKAETDADAGNAKPPTGGHWTFDEEEDAKARDTSGQGNHGRLSAPARVAGPVNQALRLNGQLLEADSMGDFERTDAFSFGGWFAWDQNAPMSPIAKISDDGKYRGYDMVLVGERLYVRLIHAWSSDVLRVQTVRPLPMKRWHHVMATYDGSSQASGLRVYIDGQPAFVKVLNDTLTGTIRNDVPLMLGGRRGGEYFHGRLDEVAVYNRQLTEQEVQALAEQGARESEVSSLPASLAEGRIGYWTFAEAEGEDPIARDRSGQNHHFTLSSSTPRVERIPDRDGRVLKIIDGGFVDCGEVAGFDSNEAFSWGAWVASGDLKQAPRWGNLVPIVKMETSARFRGYRLWIRQGQINVHLVSDWRRKNAIHIVGKKPLKTGEWQHVLVTYDGSGRAEGLGLYVDGERVEVTVALDNLSGTLHVDAPLRFGNGGGPPPGGGLIDDVRIINRELTPEDVRKLVGR